jgi:hypothetical protein
MGEAGKNEKCLVKTDTVGYLGGSGAQQCCRASPYGKCRITQRNELCINLAISHRECYPVPMTPGSQTV